jgi:AraC family carnitine catabolism transcriptional activator
LFRHHLDQTPSGLYLSFRLDRSRQLVQQTGMSVLAVAVACGFSSVSHFSRVYRQRFGLSPAKERVAIRSEVHAAL